MPLRSPFAEPKPWFPGGTLARNTPSEGALSFALLVALGMLQGVPHNRNVAVVAVFLGLGAIFLASRSLYVLWAASFAVSIAVRFQPAELWPDQVFVQFSSLAALLHGHGIYYMANGIGMSWGVYLPMADLLSAFPIWFLGSKWWGFFQVLLPLLYSLPFWIAPSQTTFRLFLGLALFVPFASLTTMGNALEISITVLFTGYWLLLRRRFLPLAAALLAYGALLRQPLVFTIPFVALALWRLRAWTALASYAAVLVFGGLVHVARNPLGFFATTFSLWPDFADQWFHKLHQKGNYSISSLLVLLGDEGAAARGRQKVYLALLALALVALAIAAWRRRTVESAVLCAIVATILAHVLNRGFVLYHYLVAAAMPALAFAGLDRGPAPPREPPPGAVARIFAAAAGAAIALCVATPLVLAVVGEIASHRPVRGRPVPLVSMKAGERHSNWFVRPTRPKGVPLGVMAGEPLRIGLAEAVVPRELVLTGAPVPPRLVDGVKVVYPTPLEVYGFLHAASVEGSLDGTTWIPLGRFRTWAHPSFYPNRIALDSHGEAVRFVRLVDGEIAFERKQWLLGGVEVYGTAPGEGGG